MTHRDSPLVVDDDQLVADALRYRGIAVVPAVWDDTDTDWARFVCVVIRSAWDYHLKANEYRAWLLALGSADVNLWNPAEAVLANIDKQYLLDLAERGVPIVPTVYLPCGVPCQLAHLLETRQWNEVVVKPGRVSERTRYVAIVPGDGARGSARARPTGPHDESPRAAVPGGSCARG